MIQSSEEFNVKAFSGTMAFTADVQRRLKAIRSMMPSSGVLLEIGVRDGSTVQFYKEKFRGKICGIDISNQMYDPGKGIIDEFKTCDLNSENIPWEDQTFDVIVCSEVIEHIFNTDHLVVELHRILKKDGILIISTPNLASLVNRIFLLLGFQPLATDVSTVKSNYGNRFRKTLQPSGHVRNFTYAAFTEMMLDHKFNIAQKRGIALIQNGGLGLVERIFSRLFPSLGGDIVLKCKKI